MTKKQPEAVENLQDAEQPEAVEKLMTFAEVSKWNRENADKLPPPQESKMVIATRKVTSL